MRRFLMVASVGVLAAGCFGGGHSASLPRKASGQHPSLIPARIAQDIRDLIGQYGRPSAMAYDRRTTALGGDSATPIYGALARGRFTVVGPPPPPGEQATPTRYNEAMVLVDSHGMLLRLNLWNRHTHADSTRQALFKRLFGTPPTGPSGY